MVTMTGRSGGAPAGWSRRSGRSVDDPFRVASCDGEARDAVEAALRLRHWLADARWHGCAHANERLLPLVERVLQDRNGPMLILDMGPRPGRSRLRSHVEASAGGCVIACYPGRATRGPRSARRSTNSGSRRPREVVRLAGGAGRCRRVRRRLAGAEKRRCMRGAGRPARPGRNRRAWRWRRHGGLDDAMFAGMAGDAAAADRRTRRRSGRRRERRSACCGAVLMQLQRLHRAMRDRRSATARTVAEAGRALRPPLFFRRSKRRLRVLRAWTIAQLGAAARAVWEAERACKRTGVPRTRSAARRWPGWHGQEAPAAGARATQRLSSATKPSSWSRLR